MWCLRLWAEKGIPSVDYLGPMPRPLSHKPTSLLSTPLSMHAILNSATPEGLRLPMTLQSPVLSHPSPSTPLSLPEFWRTYLPSIPSVVGTTLPSSAPHTPPTALVPSAGFYTPVTRGRNSVLPRSAMPALVHTPPVAVHDKNTPLLSAKLPESLITELIRCGYVLPQATPLSLNNQFAVLANDTSGTIVTPPSGLATSGLMPLLQGLPVLTPSPYGRSNPAFPADGLSQPVKNLNSLPRFQCWDPAVMHQLPTPRKWISRFANHCYLYGDWHLPSVIIYFSKGTAVDRFEQMVHNCEVTSEHMTSLWVQEKFLQQYNTCMQSESEIAREKLFNNDISMVQFPNYYFYELAFNSIVKDCANLSMEDKLAWFFQGMTADLRFAVCKQPVTNMSWPTLESVMVYTRGHILRFPTVLSTPAHFGFHSATPPRSCKLSLRGSLHVVGRCPPRLTRDLLKWHAMVLALAEVGAAPALTRCRGAGEEGEVGEMEVVWVLSLPLMQPHPTLRLCLRLWQHPSPTALALSISVVLRT